MARHARRRGRRTWPQRLLILFNSILVLACLATAGFFALAREKASQLPVVDIASQSRTSVTDDSPRNILLVGTDNADSLSKDDPARKGREKGENLADVIMILRVEPATKQAALLSIPRDTWLPVAPSWSKTKINASFASSDGASRLISTIKHNFGISIDNYAQVDFAGFRGLIEVIGGVPTYNKHPIRDRKTGLYLPETGCIVIDPVQALAYARSRTFEYQKGDTYERNGRWYTDGTSDLGRISRQQDFLRQAAKTAIDQGIRNPTTAARLVNAALPSVKVDDQMSAGQMVDLITTFRSFAVDELQTQQLPTDIGGSKSVSYQEVRWADAEPMLDIFRGIRQPGEVAAGDVIVDLPPEGALSGDLATQLDRAGFDAGTDDSSVEVPRRGTQGTVIRFGLRGIEAARVLASHLDGQVTYEFSTELPGRRLELIPGQGLLVVRDEPKPVADVPEPTIPAVRGRGTTTTSSTTTSTTTISPTTSSVVSAPTPSTLQGDVTTTTAIGVVTLDAEAAAQCDG